MLRRPNRMNCWAGKLIGFQYTVQVKTCIQYDIPDMSRVMLNSTNLLIHSFIHSLTHPAVNLECLIGYWVADKGIIIFEVYGCHQSSRVGMIRILFF